MMHQATFPTRIPKMKKKLKDLIWHKGKMDRSLGTVLFIIQNIAFSFSNTFKKLHFSKLDFLTPTLNFTFILFTYYLNLIIYFYFGQKEI